MQQQKNSQNDPKSDMNRRRHSRTHDFLFKFLVGLNVVGWCVFLAALIVFHYARPEFISGVQEFWGVTGRQQWLSSLSIYLVILLSICVLISVIVLILKRQRNRRENDYYGINGYVLMFTAVSSLVILYFQLNP
ncbi:hypothetical protein [Paraglaciecola sp.]|uniref:hypothetical protein n=1 Tax=Paraglaciecola sp. TaxID=1920173 RepID=UPI0030F493A9